MVFSRLDSLLLYFCKLEDNTTFPNVSEVLVDWKLCSGIVQGRMHRILKVCEQDSAAIDRSVLFELTCWSRYGWSRHDLIRLWSHSRKFGIVAIAARRILATNPIGCR